MYEKGYIDILGCPTIDPNLSGHPARVTPCHCAGKGINSILLPYASKTPGEEAYTLINMLNIFTVLAVQCCTLHKYTLYSYIYNVSTSAHPSIKLVHPSNSPVVWRALPQEYPTIRTVHDADEGARVLRTNSDAHAMAPYSEVGPPKWESSPCK